MELWACHRASRISLYILFSLIFIDKDKMKEAAPEYLQNFVFFQNSLIGDFFGCGRRFSPLTFSFFCWTVSTRFPAYFGTISFSLPGNTFKILIDWCSRSFSFSLLEPVLLLVSFPFRCYVVLANLWLLPISGLLSHSHLLSVTCSPSIIFLVVPTEPYISRWWCSLMLSLNCFMFNALPLESFFLFHSLSVFYRFTSLDDCENWVTLEKKKWKSDALKLYSIFLTQCQIFSISFSPFDALLKRMNRREEWVSNENRVVARWKWLEIYHMSERCIVR